MQYLVAIPVFNEAKTLRGVLQQVRRYARDILIVDDGSTDDTPRIISNLQSQIPIISHLKSPIPTAEPGLAIIRHVDNRGYGQSLIDAFKYAQAADYDWLITMDCDEQHEPAHIPDFLRAAAEDDADIISGSRYLRHIAGNSHPPADRQAINQEMTDLLNVLPGLNLTDAFCGFKAYRVASLSRLTLTVPGYGMPLQFWVQAARVGLRTREIPVRLIYNDPSRHFGGSLDDPDKRLLYYYEVLVHEFAQWACDSDSRPLHAKQRQR